MRKHVFALGCLLALAAAALPARAENLELELDTDFGPLTLKLDLEARTVSGTYPKFDGQILGTLSEDGSLIRGVWLQPKGDHRCPQPNLGKSYWGNVAFTYPNRPLPGEHLRGRWGYCGATPSEAWNGVFR